MKLNNFYNLVSSVDGIRYAMLAMLILQKKKFSKKFLYSITPGHETNIAITDRIYTYRLLKPYSNCEFDETNSEVVNSDLYKLFSNSNVTYSQETCIDLCLQKSIIKTCGCAYSPLLLLFETAICTTIAQLKCSNNVVKIHFTISFIQNQCLPICPLECKQTKYVTSISSSQLLPNIFYADVLNSSSLRSFFPNGNITLDLVQSYLIKVNIFYDSLSYTVVTESPSITVVSLLSNIGGILSLFLGVSILSVVELMEILIEIFSLSCFKKKKKSKVSLFIK